MNKVSLKYVKVEKGVSIKKKHCCCICGHVGFWTRRWTWFGSLQDLDDGSYDEVCSEKCRDEYNRKNRIPLRKREVVVIANN